MFLNPDSLKFEPLVISWIAILNYCCYFHDPARHPGIMNKNVSIFFVKCNADIYM